MANGVRNAGSDALVQASANAKPAHVIASAKSVSAMSGSYRMIIATCVCRARVPARPAGFRSAAFLEGDAEWVRGVHAEDLHFP